MKQEKYSYLTLEEREEIAVYLGQNRSFREIARLLKRNVSTVSREVNKKRDFERHSYIPSRAHSRARRNIASRRKDMRKLTADSILWKEIYTKLKLRWSPEQICRWLKAMYPNDNEFNISPNTIYNFLFVQPKGQFKMEILKLLRRKRKNRVKYSKIRNKPRVLENMVLIDERPKEALERSVPGHWEGDLVVGKWSKSVIGTLVERKTRYAIIVKPKNRSAQEVRKSFASAMKMLPPELKKTLTYDQGREMAEHQLFSKQTSLQVYFCHPASPWERGTNENTNMLVRDFFPKGTDFSKVSLNELKKVQKMLNERPRKTLDWKTPAQAFAEVLH